jgi:hypothetical protein
MKPMLPERKAENYCDQEGRCWTNNKGRYTFLLSLLVDIKLSRNAERII